MSTCPQLIKQNFRKLIFVKAKGGNPPYTFKLYVDNQLMDLYYGTETSHAFLYSFDEASFHECKTEITDSCLQTSSDLCNINVIHQCTIPIINFQILRL